MQWCIYTTHIFKNDTAYTQKQQNQHYITENNIIFTKCIVYTLILYTVTIIQHTWTRNEYIIYVYKQTTTNKKPKQKIA